jgi:hypothetical protein
MFYALFRYILPCVGSDVQSLKQRVPHVEAGSNTSTVVLRVVGGDEKGIQCLGYNLATLFLGDINTGTWLSRLGSLESETAKCGHESRGTRS